MKDTEELLRSVMHDPAYDVTPDRDLLAPVWGKARAIRRRRALTASGTAVVVVAAAATVGVLIARPDANGGPTVKQPVLSTSVAPPTSAPSAGAPTPSPSTGTTTTFTHTAVAIENPVSNGLSYLAGTETSARDQSVRLVVLDVTSGTIRRSAWVPGPAGDVAFAGTNIYLTVPGTKTLEVATTGIDLDSAPSTIGLTAVTDPRGALTGPIAAGDDGDVWVADADGVAKLHINGGSATAIASVAAPARVCELASTAGGLYIVGGPQGGACIQATHVDTATGTGTDVADASDASLGLARLVPDATGFWVEQPTGTMGFYEHVTYSPASGRPPVVAPDHISGSNGMQASIADGKAWISDPGVLQCADASGKVLWQKDLSADDGAAHVFSSPGGAVLVTNTYAEPFDTSVCR